MARKQQTDAERAAQSLAPERLPNRAERAALDHLRERRWILWHAEDYAAGVVRLLTQAGLLRDTYQEAEAAHGGSVMRRLADRDHALDNRRAAAIDQLITDAAEQLQGGDDPADVAALLLSKRAEVNAITDKAKRAPLTDDAENDRVAGKLLDEADFQAAQAAEQEKAA